MFEPPSTPPPVAGSPPGWGGATGPAPPAPAGWQQPPPGYGPAPPPASWQPQGGYGYGPPPAPPRSNKGVWIVLGIVLGVIVFFVGGCFVLIAVIGNAVGETLEEAIDEINDFTNAVPATGPTSCEVTGVDTVFDDYIVDVSATNDSGVTSAYRISYELFGPDDTSLGTDYGDIDRIEPGQSATSEIYGFVDIGPNWTEVSCDVISALRLPVS
jgi:hypothetical protein